MDTFPNTLSQMQDMAHITITFSVKNMVWKSVNFRQNENGELICPNNKRFIYKCDRHIYKNKYGRTEEIYECEDCSDCPYRSECCKKKEGNRTARLNRELTSMH